MIVAFSTSSPRASVALLSPFGELRWAGEEHAPGAASGACIGLLERMQGEAGFRLDQATHFASDLGPGGFTGVRVGVTLAKTFAFVHGANALGATSFDLIDPAGLVVIPSKRGEYFVRAPGGEPYRTTELPLGPFSGYGFPDGETYPNAARFAPLVHRLVPVLPELLLPEYGQEPSISAPKRPYAPRVSADG